MFAADKSAALAAKPLPIRAANWPRWMRSTWCHFRHMQDRRRQRRALLELDEHLLADIGVSREQAKREANKLFWMPTESGR